MKLLTFAHRNEAKAFFSNDQFKLVPGIVPECYQNNNTLLLITGEGTYNAISKTALLLGQKKFSIKHIINLGIVGGLNQSLKKFSIVDVRTIYCENGKDVEFKSFTTINSKADVDCISSSKRVFDATYSQKLACFADIVDRELWGVAFAAHSLNIPLSSHKIISDTPELDTNICEMVQENSLQYAEKLYQYYQQFYGAKSTAITPAQVFDLADYFSPQHFHFSSSMRLKILSILKKLIYKENTELSQYISQLDLAPFIQMKLPAKNRSLKLIQALETKLSPFSAHITSLLQAETKLLEQNKIKIQYADQLENDQIKLTLDIFNLKTFLGQKNAINQLDFEKIQNILNGKFHV